tara:strand:- start:9862 stop:10206 length:345 start_codon:yes stop_codon:yes gene_type:complete
MKLLNYILAFTVLFLSAKPTIDILPFSTENQQTCCSSSKCSPISDNQNSEDGNNDEESGICNPFQACGSCLLLCINAPFYETLQVDIPTEQYFYYQSFIASKFISDFWQPPQFV